MRTRCIPTSVSAKLVVCSGELLRFGSMHGCQWVWFRCFKGLQDSSFARSKSQTASVSAGPCSCSWTRTTSHCFVGTNHRANPCCSQVRKGQTGSLLTCIYCATILPHIVKGTLPQDRLRKETPQLNWYNSKLQLPQEDKARPLGVTTEAFVPRACTCGLLP